MLTCLLEWPPSTNELWRTFKGRSILSRRARDWTRDGIDALKLQNLTPIKGQFTVLIELAPPHNRPYDPDNRQKAVLDLLVREGYIEGDTNRFVRAIHVIPDAPGFIGVRVTITPLGEDDGRYFRSR